MKIIEKHQTERSRREATRHEGLSQVLRAWRNGDDLGLDDNDVSHTFEKAMDCPFSDEWYEAILVELNPLVETWF